MTPNPRIDYQKILVDAACPPPFGPAITEELRKLGYEGNFPDLDCPNQEVHDVLAAVSLAVSSMHEIDKTLRPEERRRRKEIADLRDPTTATLACALPEKVFRPGDSIQQWVAFMEVVAGVGVPNNLSLYERTGLNLASNPLLGVAPELVTMAMRQTRNHILNQVGGFVKIFPDDDARGMVDHFEKEAEHTGVGYELNLVTESARTQLEADQNIRWYQSRILADAKRLAIKPTAIVPFSDSPIAKPSTKKKLARALAQVLETADEISDGSDDDVAITVDSEGSPIIDMVRDAVIMAGQEFPQVKLQLAMQAIVPDTETLLLDPMLAAAKKRVEDQKGRPLGTRLVCGANEQTENLLSSVMGWGSSALTGSRPDTHANYMRLRDRMIDPLKDGKFVLTIASMNLVTIMHSLIGLAKAGVFASKNGGFVDFGMLEGMTGQEVFRYLRQKYNVKGHKYTPVISLSKVVELFKYYLRRIKELGGGEGDDCDFVNYLGVMAGDGMDSPRFARTQVKNGILAAVQRYRKTEYPLNPGILPYRGKYEPVVKPVSLRDYRPVPQMAPGSEEDGGWIDRRIENLNARTDADAVKIPIEFHSDALVNIGLAPRGRLRELKKLKGPTRPDLVLAKYETATYADVDEAFRVASEDLRGWSTASPEARRRVLSNVVDVMRRHREPMVEGLMGNIGKSVAEADAEVNEAMDFANLAVLHMEEILKRPWLKPKTDGDGVALVICPKNFPQAIPAAHILGRLMAGYRVIVKPSGGEDEESVLATYEMVKCFHAAGVPKEALIFLPCDNTTAIYMANKAERGGFTGSTTTARRIRENNPKIDIIAETGGRNFIIVDSTVDLKEVATSILMSICGFAGQKCSKPIAIIATKDVDIEELKMHLAMQWEEMLVGTAITRHVDVTPLSKKHEPGDPLYEKAMKCLPGESWLKARVALGIQDIFGDEVFKTFSAEPAKMGDPGIRFVSDGWNFDFSSLEEIFAPVATLVQIVGGVDDAVKIVNGVKGSLTGSLFSQNRLAIDYALQHWRTGNLYIRQKCTGALAHQGFGDGVGDSHEGAHGAKTGTLEWMFMNGSFEMAEGEHAQYEIVEEDETGLKEALQKLQSGLGEWETYAPDTAGQIESAIHAGYSYLYEYQRYFSQRRPAPYQTIGQYDWIESQSVGKVCYRFNRNDSLKNILGKIFAAVAGRNPLRISIPVNERENVKLLTLMEKLGGKFGEIFDNVEVVYEDDEQFVAAIKGNSQLPKEDKIAFVTYADRDNVPVDVFKAAAEASLYVETRAVTGDGRNDLVTQFRQQSYCWVTHNAGDTRYEDTIGKNHPEWAPY